MRPAQTRKAPIPAILQAAQRNSLLRTAGVAVSNAGESFVRQLLFPRRFRHRLKQARLPARSAESAGGFAPSAGWRPESLNPRSLGRNNRAALDSPWPVVSFGATSASLRPVPFSQTAWSDNRALRFGWPRLPCLL